MKKILALLIMAAMLLSASSCIFDNEKKEDVETAAKKEDTTVSEETDAPIVIRSPKTTGTVATSEYYEISSQLFSYFFYSTYNQYVSNYSYYLSSLGLDTSVSIKEQKYNDEDTWFDYFVKYTEYQLSQMIGLASSAKAEGLELTDELKSQLENSISSIASYAEAYEMDEKEYLEAVFCEGMTTDVVREAIELQMFAQLRYDEIYNEGEYTEEDFTECVNENPEDFYNVGYIWYTFAAETDEDGNVSEEALAEAKAKADKLAGAEDEEAFRKEVYDLLYEKYAASGEYTAETTLDALASAALDEYASYGLADTDGAVDDWLLDDERQVGDVTIYTEEDNYGYSVFMLTETKRLDESHNVNVRHILLKTDTYGNDAEAKAEEVYELWKNGEATEDSFAALANEYSEDTGSNTAGGLYSDVYDGEFVETFNDWCFDEAREPGDSGIIETDYGYHVMYFSSRNELSKWQNEALSDLRYAHAYEATFALEDQYKVEYLEDFSDYIDC